MSVFPRIDYKALIQIKACRRRLTAEQYSTLRGQVFAGDGDGALRALREVLLIEGSNAIKTH